MVKKIQRLTASVFAAALLLAGGCAHYRDLPPGTVKAVASPIVVRQAVQVPTVAEETEPPAEYLIGVNDVLFININGKPEFFVSPGGANSKLQGSRVDAAGRVNLPLAGPVQVAGLTPAKAQVVIQKVLRKYLRDPWVVVEIAEYRSQPLYLLGQFRAPGTFYMDRPLNLVQGLALANGFGPDADLRGATLTRAGKIVPVDIHDLLTGGNARQNIWLRGGDTIYLPDGRNQQIFIFGAVKKPGPVAVPPGGLSLSQAIGTTDLQDVGHDVRFVRIIRSLSATRGELIVVDFDKMLRGEALPFQLMGGDVVYVPRSAFGTWNETIKEILPSLQAVSALLQPFVNIRFLTRD